MKRFKVLFVALTVLTLPLFAQDKKMMGKEREVTLNGEVVDVSCYVEKGAKGESHKECAITCAKNGWPLGILTKDGKLYVAMTAMGYDCIPNKVLMEHIGHQVEVTGYTHSKGGVNGISIANIAMAK